MVLGRCVWILNSSEIQVIDPMWTDQFVQSFRVSISLHFSVYGADTS